MNKFDYYVLSFFLKKSTCWKESLTEKISKKNWSQGSGGQSWQNQVDIFSRWPVPEAGGLSS